jgi:dTDP-4-dehydrorhamnose 3,5-epimerase
MSFDVIDTPIPGLKIIQRESFHDDRGFLTRLYCDDNFKLIGIDKPIRQINQTNTKKKGTLRGMHFQRPPFAEIKLVSCIRGKIFDVAVDLRKNSPTFLKWHGEVLSQTNQRSFLIPEGFAHGFQALTDNCELIYLHTAPYSREFEDALNLMDKKLDITWPLKIFNLSKRDQSHPIIKNDFEGIIL